MTRQHRMGRSRIVSPTGLPFAGLTAGGFLLGMLIARMGSKGISDTIGFLRLETLQQLLEVTVLPQTLFFYLWRKCCKELIFLLLLSMTPFGKLGMDAYLVWLGTLQGIFFMTLVLQYGGRGMGLFVLTAIPQSLILLPALWLLFLLNRSLYTTAYHLKCGAPGMRRKDLIRSVCLCFGLYTFAAWLQSYINPFLLQKILPIF